MAIKNGLRTLLLAQSSITTLCPAQTVQGTSYSKVFTDAIKQGIEAPYIRIRRTAYDNNNTLDGSVGTGKSTIEIKSVANTEPAAEALAKAVSDYLKDYAGAAGGSDTIVSVDWDNAADEMVPEQIGKDVWRYGVTQVYRVWHR